MSKPFTIHIENTSNEAKTYTLHGLLGGLVPDADLLKIRDMWMGNKETDREIALGWLGEKLKSQRAALANILMLYLVYPMADHEGKEKTKFTYPDADGCYYEKYRLNEQNYFSIEYETYPIYFGKNYRYRYRFEFMVDGIMILDTLNDYSRTQVGEGDPQSDFAIWMGSKLVDEHHLPFVVWRDGTVHLPENYTHE